MTEQNQRDLLIVLGVLTSAVGMLCYGVWMVYGAIQTLAKEVKLWRGTK